MLQLLWALMTWRQKEQAEVWAWRLGRGGRRLHCLAAVEADGRRLCWPTQHISGALYTRVWRVFFWFLSQAECNWQMAPLGSASSAARPPPQGLDDGPPSMTSFSSFNVFFSSTIMFSHTQLLKLARTSIQKLHFHILIVWWTTLTFNVVNAN